MSPDELSATADSVIDLRDALKQAIANGEYAPGVKLVERELTQRYGVGRTGVRDAIRHLAAQGIIELTENRGARVSELSYAAAIDMYQVRGVLEGLAGELFAVRGTAEEKIVFAESLEPIRVAIEASDITAALIASDIYYSHLLQGARNTELHEIIEQLHVRINQIRRVSLSVESQAKPTIDALQKIVNAVLAGDPTAARNACIEHVKASAAATLPAMAHTLTPPQNSFTTDSSGRPN